MNAQMSNAVQGVTAVDFRAAQWTLWGAAGAWAYDTWHDLNAEHFTGELVYAGIVFGLTPHGHRLGQCFSDGRITLHSSLLDPRGAAPWGKAAATWTDLTAHDVLLHEMIHAALFARGVDSSHNSDTWCAELERLSPTVLGFPVKAEPVKPRRIDGKVARRQRDGYLTRDEISRWPYSIRPDAREYYRDGVHLEVRH